MSDITTVSTDATALELLITEFADASNELDRIFAECHAAHGIAALKPEGVSQTDYLKATAVSHTALLQRAKAWEYALYMGDSPSSAVVAATFRLASASGAAKDAREKFEKDMKSASIKGVSEEDFQKAALDAAKSVPAPAGGASGNGGAQAEPEMDVNLALKALAWLAANSAEVTGDDRERVLAQARALSTLYKK
jgi:hypothetical protein